MSSRRALTVSVPLVLLAITAPAAAVTDPSPKRGASVERADTDVRDGRSVAVPADRRRARQSALGSRGTVRTDPRTGGVAQFTRDTGFLTGPSKADPEEIALGFVARAEDVFGLDADDLDALSLQARDVSPDGVTHLRWVQVSEGIPSLDSGLEAHVTTDGRLISVQGSGQPDLTLSTTTPTVSASAALAAARQDTGGSGIPPAPSGGSGRTRATRFGTGEQASLVAFPQGDSARLAWRVLVDGADPVSYVVTVDAGTGEVLARASLTDFATGSDIFERFPGASGGGSATTLPLDADPVWLNDTAGGTRLAGANTHTYADFSAPNGVNAGEDVASNGGGNWTFPQSTTFPGAAPCPSAGCTWDSTTLASSVTNRAQATTSLFFHVNRFHDYLRDSAVGFDEASGAFQGVDRVLAEANDSSGFDNANFNTPPNGASGRMQQYLFTTQDVNSSDDASVIYHEYTHGLTNRLVVDAGGFGALGGADQPRAMGEGWSDFYAMDYLVHRGFATDSAAPGDVRVGDYVVGGFGIRAQAVDCEVDQVVLPACPLGGYTYEDIRTLAIPHGMGVMWAQTLWDVRRAVARRDGDPALSDAEHDQVLLLVTGGLRLSPDQPNYLAMRDAILQEADVLAALPGGIDHRPMLSEVFARRGLGTDASSANGSRTAATEGFALPAGVGSLRPSTVSFDDSFARGGDGDGTVEAGETVGVTVAVSNVGTADVSGVAGAPAAIVPGVTVAGGPVTFPAVPTGGAPVGGTSFTMTLPASASCGGTLRNAAALSVTSGIGGPTVLVSPALGAPIVEPADPTVGPGVATTVPIPDNTPAGVSQDVVVPDGTGGTIGDLNLRVTATHTWISDLQVTLTHVDTGTSALVFDRHGGSGDNLTGTVFDDEAATAVGAGAPPYSGRFRPTNPLDVFDGEDLAGTWRLTVVDNVAVDTGSLLSWNLNASEPTACPVTRPSAATGDATGVTTSEAIVNGVAGAGPTTPSTGTRFVYGTTTAYGAQAETGEVSAESGEAKSASLTGLEPSTTYHYRLETLRGGTLAVAGEDRTFTTPAPPPPPPPPTPAPTPPTGGGEDLTGAAPTPTPGPLTAAGIRFTGTPKRITLSSKGTFGLRFGATGGTKGTLTIKATVLGKKSRKTKKRGKSRTVTLVNNRAFTADSKGNVVFKTLASSKSGFRKLPKATKTFRAVLQVKVGSRTFTHRFTFQRAKKKATKRR